MGFDPRGETARVTAERISASGAGICFVALGAPKQELFSNAALTWSEGVVYLGVGAALDFIAGERSRAPRVMQRIGLEWLWRTAQEPRRMLPRYLKSALWLVGYLLRLTLGTARAKAIPVEIAIDPRATPPEAQPIAPQTNEGPR
jgi:UDP-N-acetyl-D-mannosaminuronic acid transferase (WecB/TagA/CpsF family)